MRLSGTVAMALTTALAVEVLVVMFLEIGNGGHWPVDPASYALVVLVPPLAGGVRAYRYFHASEFDRRLMLMRPLKSEGLMVLAVLVSSVFVAR